MSKKAGGSNEKIEWQASALMIGERLADCGPDGYYNFTAYQWLEWADKTLKERRNNIIEECAKVCEWRDTDLDPEDKEYNPDAWGWCSKDYARNIRYLKNKP